MTITPLGQALRHLIWAEVHNASLPTVEHAVADVERTLRDFIRRELIATNLLVDKTDDV